MRVSKISKLDCNGKEVSTFYMRPSWLIDEEGGPVEDFLNHGEVGRKIQIEMLNLTEPQFHKCIVDEATTGEED